jgi:hypothetical protein
MYEINNSILNNNDYKNNDKMNEDSDNEGTGEQGFLNLINPHRLKTLFKKYKKYKKLNICETSSLNFNESVEIINENYCIDKIIINSKMLLQSNGQIPKSIKKIIIKKSKISKENDDPYKLSTYFSNFPNILVYFKTYFLSNANKINYNHLPNSIIELSITKVNSRQICFTNKIDVAIINPSHEGDKNFNFNSIPHNISCIISTFPFKIKKKGVLTKKMLSYTEKFNLRTEYNCIYKIEF